MQEADFLLTEERLMELAQDALKMAKSLGATACTVDLSESYGLNVTVRRSQIETIEHMRDKGLLVTTYVNQCKGHASTSDFSASAIEASVSKAISVARVTEEDAYAGLADEDLIFKEELPDLDLFHPRDISVDDSAQLARICEQAAFDVSPLVHNSDGVTHSSVHAQFVAANSVGLAAGYPTTCHTLSCRVLAEKDHKMQGDGWYSSERNWRKLADPKAIGEYAARRALSRLGAVKLSTRHVPVLFEAPAATGLIGAYVFAVSGGQLYRHTTFLLDSLGKMIFPTHVNITEDPFVLGGLASGAFDADGVRTQKREVVQEGVNNGYFLSAYTARKLGMQTTGNAGGCHNLRVADNGYTLRTLLKEMGTGLFVTELIGTGINYVTGDYSRGASGYWVEGGEICYPVQEITIASNLKSMFKGIVAIGNDRVIRGSRNCGSILIDRMTVAGQ